LFQWPEARGRFTFTPVSGGVTVSGYEWVAVGADSCGLALSEVAIVFDGPAVRERLLRIVEDEDLRKYIL
jgi:hypothetical protein